VSCIDDISEVDVGRTVTLMYTAPDEAVVKALSQYDHDLYL